MEKRKFRALVEDMVSTLIERTKVEVPEEGAFSTVYEVIYETDEKCIIDKYRMEVMKMPSINEPDESIRFIKFSSYFDNCSYKVSSLAAGGSKAKMIEVLSEEGFVDRAMSSFYSHIETAEWVD